MGQRVAAIIGLLLLASYVLFIAFKIRTGAGPLIAICLAVIAMACVDAWQGALRGGRRN